MRIRQIGAAVTMFGLLAGALTTVSGPANAARASRPAHSDGYDWITAKSKYGEITISGPTRKSQFGREVRMPGGTWIDCAGDCSEALRIATIDFWFEQERMRRNVP